MIKMDESVLSMENKQTFIFNVYSLHKVHCHCVGMCVHLLSCLQFCTPGRCLSCRYGRTLYLNLLNVKSSLWLLELPMLLTRCSEFELARALASKQH